MHIPDYDFIIVGQGLAGSILAYTLIERGLRVLVIDNNHYNSASMVAAGIINPISGQRLSLSEDFEAHFSSAKKFYTELQSSMKSEFFRSIQQFRLLSKSSQLDYLQRRNKQIHYQPYIGELENDTKNYPGALFGKLSVQRTAIVDTKSLLSEIQIWLINKNSYLDHRVEYHSLNPRDGYFFKVADKTAKQLIFCEGYQATKNPWLKNLPFKLAKGEILNIKLEQKTPNILLNWGKWLLPNIDQTTAKLGSTYDWNDLNNQTNLENQKVLINDLLLKTRLKGKIKNSEVGIRPATASRIPFIGEISALPNAYCFNGFGSKGCLLIPYYAELFCDALASKKSIPEELTKWL